MCVKQIRLQMVAALVALFGATLFLFWSHAPVADAVINQQINFQGKLTNPDGTNVADGTYSIVFTIYSGGTSTGGGTNVWTETQSSVSISSGVFQVQLGSVNTTLGTAVNFNTTPLYLGVKVGADAEMSPRIQFTAAPYAFNADQVDGLDASSLVQLAQGIQADSSTTNASIAINKTGGTAKVADFQRNGTSVFSVNNDGSVLIKSQTNSATAFQVQSSGSINVLTADTNSNAVDIGSNVADATQVLLQLDSYSTYADGTCTTSSNQGALYYNTNTNTIRSCVNGGWEDAVTTSGLGILAFGVIPDSGNAGTPGDIAGVTGNSNSPCKVVWTNTSQVTVEPCMAYSGGRRVIIPLTNLSTSGLAVGAYSNVCLTAAGGQPALGTANTTETSAALPTFSANNPVLCLATVRASTTVAGNVGFIWDTRTFTNTQKQFTSINSANSNGYVVIGTTTLGTVATIGTAASGPLRGVVVATSGAASSTTVNGIIATQGPVFAKFVSGSAATINNCLQTTGTAGFGVSVACNSVTTAGNFLYGGTLQSSISTSCASTNTALTACQYSPLVDFRPSR